MKAGFLHFDCFFRTDYREYTEHLTRAKALHRYREWTLVRKEYLRAFALFRGEPFRKMYDDWSDDKRLEVLFGYEKEITAFVRELKNRKDEDKAQEILEWASRIVTS